MAGGWVYIMADRSHLHPHFSFRSFPSRGPARVLRLSRMAFMLPLMRPLPNIDMRDLRDLAARKWDALTSLKCSPAATDRYDRFLATGAVMLWNGATEAEVGDYFADVETRCLGLHSGAGTRMRAREFATAIREHLDQCSSR